MSLLYILSTLLLLITLTFKKFFDKKVNVMFLITINIVVIMCYTSFCAYILNLLYIPITLISMTVLNLIPSLYFLYDILKKKNINSFYFRKSDIIILFILIIISIIVFFLFFTKDFLFSYNSPDAAAHFTSSRYFALGDSLNTTLNIKNAQNYGNGFQFLGYVNLGMLFKSFNFLSILDLYKIFVIFNLFLFVLTGYSFYLISKKEKRKKNILLAFFVTILYTLGYPLNNLLYGLFYWGIGILIINTIINFISQYKINDSNKIYSFFVFNILTFGLFCSYYIFVPIVYPSLLIYFTHIYKENNKIKSKEFLLLILISLIIPFIFGCLYFLVPNLSNFEEFTSGITSEGMSYKNFISNFILLIPFIIYGYKLLEEKNFIKILCIFTVIVVSLLLFSVLCGSLSAYYFHKTYFLIWLLSWYLVYIALIKIEKENNLIFKSFIISYILIFFFSIFKLEERLKEFNFELTGNTILSQTMDIYNHNFDLILNPTDTLNKSCIDGIKYITNNKEKLINENNEISTIGSYWQLRWVEALTDIFPKYNYNGNLISYKYKQSLKSWYKNENNKNLIIFKDDFNKSDLENIKILFENKCMLIVTKNN